MITSSCRVVKNLNFLTAHQWRAVRSSLCWIFFILQRLFCTNMIALTVLVSQPIWTLDHISMKIFHHKIWYENDSNRGWGKLVYYYIVKIPHMPGSNWSWIRLFTFMAAWSCIGIISFDASLSVTTDDIYELMRTSIKERFQVPFSRYSNHYFIQSARVVLRNGKNSIGERVIEYSKLNE